MGSGCFEASDSVIVLGTFETTTGRSFVSRKLMREVLHKKWEGGMRTDFSSGAAADWWGFRVRSHAFIINSLASRSSDT